MSALKFSPVDCTRYIRTDVTAQDFRDSHPTVPWRYNPWTGELRESWAIEKDPYGQKLDVAFATFTAENALPVYVALRPVEPVPEVQDTITTTLSERGKRYGKFTDHAKITQDLKAVMHNCPKWAALAPDQKEALEMTAHKIGRILNGDPNYDDSWVDIAGYTKLVADRLQGVER